MAGPKDGLEVKAMDAGNIIKEVSDNNEVSTHNY